MSRMIRTSLSTVSLYVMFSIIFASNLNASALSTAMPSAIEPSADYLFFFHNYYVEIKGPDGECKYDEILKAFSEKGVIVISEIRPPVSPVEYAEKAVLNIRKILDTGVPPEQITVAGHSKGGVIALQVAALLEEPKINYVILAGCGIKPLAGAYPDFSRLQGNFLSVYAESDTVAGSCKADFLKASQGLSSKEIVLESTAGHRLFFVPTNEWVDPVMTWLTSGNK